MTDPTDGTRPSAPGDHELLGDHPSAALNRRRFLGLMGIGAAWAMTPVKMLHALAPIAGIQNPLDYYPNRDWEKIYLDQYRYDRSFTWVCAPNDTHMCRLRGFVRNGVLIRSEQNYDHSRYGDLYGNRLT